MQNVTKIVATTVLGSCAAVLVGAAAAAQMPSQAEAFRLTHVAGQTLPVVTERDGDCQEELLGATLTLQTDGSWTLVSRERENCGGTVEEDEDRDGGSFTVEGQTVRFLNEDGEPEEAETDGDDVDIDVEDLAVGTRSTGALTVRLADGNTVLEFRQ